MTSNKRNVLLCKMNKLMSIQKNILKEYSAVVDIIVKCSSADDNDAYNILSDYNQLLIKYNEQMELAKIFNKKIKQN